MDDNIGQINQQIAELHGYQFEPYNNKDGEYNWLIRYPDKTTKYTESFIEPKRMYWALKRVFQLPVYSDDSNLSEQLMWEIFQEDHLIVIHYEHIPEKHYRISILKSIDIRSGIIVDIENDDLDDCRCMAYLAYYDWKIKNGQ